MRSIKQIKTHKRKMYFPIILRCKHCLKQVIEPNELYCKNSVAENICLLCSMKIISSSIKKINLELEKQMSLKKSISEYLEKNKSVEAKYVCNVLEEEEFKKI